MNKLMEWRAHLCGTAAVRLAMLGLVAAPMEARAEIETAELLQPAVPVLPKWFCGGEPPNLNFVGPICSGECPPTLLIRRLWTLCRGDQNACLSCGNARSHNVHNLRISRHSSV